MFHRRIKYEFGAYDLITRTWASTYILFCDKTQVQGGGVLRGEAWAK